MRGVVAKRLRKEAAEYVKDNKIVSRTLQLIYRVLAKTEKDHNKYIDKITIKHEGYRRIYQNLKHQYSR